MISIGIIYPEFKVLSKVDNVLGLEGKTSTFNSSKIIELKKVENPELLISAFEENIHKDQHDFGVILTNNLNKNKVYFINFLKLTSISENNLYIKVFSFGASKGVFKAWKDFYSKGIDKPRLWKNLKPAERQGWLELAISFQNIKNSDLVEDAVIDGKYIHHIDDFFCELGESINGYGGYFGRSFNALIDCIISPEFGGNNLKRIIWKNHKRNIWKLKKNFKVLQDIFREYNIEVVLQ